MALLEDDITGAGLKDWRQAEFFLLVLEDVHPQLLLQHHDSCLCQCSTIMDSNISPNKRFLLISDLVMVYHSNRKATNTLICINMLLVRAFSSTHLVPK